MTRSPLPCLLATLLLAGPLAAAEGAAAPPVLNPFDAPFHYAYQDWEERMTVAGGVAHIAGRTSRGGGGVNGALDLAAHAERSPALRLRTRAGSRAQGLVLIVSDVQGRSGRWQFRLPPPAAEFATVTPQGGAPLALPNQREDRESPKAPRPLDLAHVVQYQFCGDWSDQPIDVEIDALVLVDADDRLRAERAERTRLDAEAAAKAAREAAEAGAREAKRREQLVRSYGYANEQSPLIVQTGLAAPDVVAITIEAQRITPARIAPYQPQPGDEKIEERWPDGGGNHGVRRAKLMRGGTCVGYLQGARLDQLAIGEGVEGHPFLAFLADPPGNYTVTSADDPAFAAGVRPLAVHRKTLPTNAQLPWGAYPTRTRLYLRLPQPVRAGCTYQVQTRAINVRNPDPRFTADFARLPSEAVHVSQIGYRPDDPLKRATLSVWLGTGGAYRFPAGLRFSLVDEAGRTPVFSGAVELAMDADGSEQLWSVAPRNYARTAVYRMDFGAFTTPGTYRVVVEGVGCSLPFEIGAKAWEKAFLVQMQGLYNNRSGEAVGPPYSAFVKPRDFHPDDGAVVTRSAFDVMAKGMYRSADIPEGDTGETVTDAWGGYHDAGDWNPRRASHLLTTLAQLELAEIHPGYFNALRLSIPPAAGIPDLLTEARFEIDCFRRLQRPDGGIPYGIESQVDPMFGEVSWLSTQHLYVVAPTMRDSCLYAAAAARLAKLLWPFDAAQAAGYLDSARRAFAWAEGEYGRRGAAGALAQVKDLWMTQDARNLAALVLYDLTGERPYHDAFLSGTCLKDPGAELCAWDVHIQTDAAFLYARLDDARADARIKANARAAILRLAEASLAYAAGNAFNLTSREKGRPMFAGFFSVSGGMELARAHFLTGERRYLLGAVQSCQFQAGCNPNNLVYTTGLGSNPVRNPLHLDSRSSGQPAPPGLTVFGNSDYWSHRGGFWDINLQFVNKPDQLWPDAYDWPLHEAYFDVWLLVSANEFVIDTWQQNVFVWGYLAARP
ncbi:MAG: glycoside hydrolase family 9 protein [Planctomycetes bacterium]|nr:glycoside hydrolase family 9 protein [Planctomycetota bacterium]